MHKYLILRGDRKFIKEGIKEIEKIYLKFDNKKTGKKIGHLQLHPREIKLYELTFPAKHKGKIKGLVEGIFNKIHEKKGRICGGVALHWGPWKKDKFIKGVEQI